MHGYMDAVVSNEMHLSWKCKAMRGNQNQAVGCVAARMSIDKSPLQNHDGPGAFAFTNLTSGAMGSSKSL